ncbi:MAG: NADP-dependent oxidoreductase [Thermoleophilia bacterium]
MPLSREIHLKARPQGAPQPADFALVETDVPEPAEGQVLIRNAFVSVDPYMRGRMNDAKSYVPPFQLGEVMTGAAVGRIVMSRNDGFEEGAWVVHHLGWRELALSDGKDLLLFDTTSGPVSAGLGVLGMPGLTAYVGLLDVGRVEAGETVFVSGAAGAVGSAVGQIAKLKGCRVIGSAGSAEKVVWLKEIGFDEAFDYHDVVAGEALSDGIDVYFDNVGGPMLEAALAALRVRGRVVACGAISQYNATELPTGPRNLFLTVTKRLRIEGFIVSDHFDRMSVFLGEVGPWVADGRVRYRETVVEGIENAPAAFIGLLAGENIGKMLVQVGPGNT